MLSDIECPNPAYNRIINSELYERILQKREQIEFLVDIPYEMPGKRIIHQARAIFFNPDRRISERSEVARDILELERIFDEEDFYLADERVVEAMLTHPALIANIILGEDVLRFRNYGFPTRRSLETALVSFAIGEEESFDSTMNRDYVWRNGDMKNTISQNTHGDLYAGQTDVSGKESTETTLFGEVQEFDVVKRDVEYRGISAYQDWSQFLAATLRYAEAIGRADLPEIVNWRDVLEQTGSVGTNTTEAMFGDGGMDMTEFLMREPILQERVSLNSWPLTIFAGSDYIFLPYVKDRDLLYLEEKEDGEVEVQSNCPTIDKKRFSVCLRFSESDLPHILRATYKYFARDRSKLPKIMSAFINKTYQVM